MQSSTMMILLASMVVISAGFAGCTSQAPSAAQVPGTTPATISAADTARSATWLSAMVLQPSEIPGNFTLVTKHERSASELSEWALGHGWKEGYSVVYQKNDPNSPSGTIIRQNISVYAGENATLAVSDTIDGLFAWIKEENDTNMSVEKLSIPSIGDASGSLKYADKRDNTGMYVIAFAKNGVFQDIETNGTAEDYETAQQLATIAAAKIR